MTWGIQYPDGTYTGPIAQFARDLTHYAKLHDGKVYELGGVDDPENSTSSALAGSQAPRNTKESNHAHETAST